MTTTYLITSEAGVDLGTYAAESADDALDALARDAGYASAAAAEAEGVGRFVGTVVEVDETGHFTGRGRLYQAVAP